MEPSIRDHTHLLRRDGSGPHQQDSRNYTAEIAQFFNTTLPPSQQNQRAGHYLTPVEIILLLFATVFWLMRIYGRHKSKSFGPDDVFVTLALMCTYTLTVLHNVAIFRWGLGKHYLDHSINYEMLGVLEWTDSFVFTLSALFAKMSVLCFYLRFAEALSVRFRYGVYAVMVFVALWTLSIATLLLFVCRPLSAWWSLKSLEDGGQCLSAERVGIVLFLLGALNMVSDFIVFLLPVKVLWDTLKSLSGWQRVRVMVMPTLGLFACIAGAVRIKPLVDLLRHQDPSWFEYPIYTLVAVEIDLIITCACLPFSKPAIDSILALLSTVPFISKIPYLASRDCNCTSPSCSRSHSASPSGSPEEMTRRRPSAAHIYGAVDCMIYCNDGQCDGRMSEGDGLEDHRHHHHHHHAVNPEEDLERGRTAVSDKTHTDGAGALKKSVERSGSERSDKTAGSGSVKFNSVVFS